MWKGQKIDSKFAHNQLTKFGWSEGAGLGRNEHGIKEAIRVKLKFDQTGVGHDPGKDFTTRWWEDVYNTKAKNFKSKDLQNGAKEVAATSKLIDNDKKSFANQYASKLYGKFIKGAVLTNSVNGQVEEKYGSSSDDDDKAPVARALTDEELFKICGGRTAHKGARHGLGLSGKLQRIQEQDAQKALDHYGTSSKSISSAEAPFLSETSCGETSATVKRTKAIKLPKVKNSNKGCSDVGAASGVKEHVLNGGKAVDLAFDANCSDCEEVEDSDTSPVQKCKTSKKNRNRIQNDDKKQMDLDSEIIVKSKKKKNMDSSCESPDFKDYSGTFVSKKKKKKQAEENDVSCKESSVDVTENGSHPSATDERKKKKRKKNKDTSERLDGKACDLLSSSYVKSGEEVRKKKKMSKISTE